jgi:hypothetical protein
MNDVILFLTSPRTPERESLSLTNLRQLAKLGKDIIVMSTVPNINEEYYRLAKLVTFDFFQGKISKFFYKKANTYPIPYLKPFGAFYYSSSDPKYLIYTDTHFLSVFRNTKNLIKLSYALNYKNFFYVEDDHYFSETGLAKLNEYFLKIEHNAINALYFTNVWTGLATTKVTHPHFWFGNSAYFNESVLHKFPENYDELESQFPYTCDYETFLYNASYLYVHNKTNVILESVKEGGFEYLFGSDTIINQIFSHFNISDDSRINIIPYKQPNIYKLILNFKKFEITDDFIYVKVYINDELLVGIPLKLKESLNVIDLNLNLENKPNIKIVFNSDVVKEFKELTKDNVSKNGSWDDV